MQVADLLALVELSMKQENQETLDLVDDYAANLHVGRFPIFFWALLKPQVAGDLPMGGRR